MVVGGLLVVGELPTDDQSMDGVAHVNLIGEHFERSRDDKLRAGADSGDTDALRATIRYL